MQQIVLGQTGLLVSKLCYGTLTLCSSQSNKTPRQGGELIAYALRQGVSFLDTAQFYDVYPHIREALKLVSKPPVISTKSYAWDQEGARKSVDQARREMDVDVIDIFMMHEQETVLTMLGHSEALKYYLSMKERGIIKAIGLSTHAIEPVQALVKSRGGVIQNAVSERIDEFDLGLFREIDVVHPILNIEGLGLRDGNVAEMEQAARAASGLGIGVFGMKLLGGGNLLNDFERAIRYAMELDFVHAFAVGMQSKEEIDLNIALFNGLTPDPVSLEAVKKKKRKILIEDWCTGCGNCTRKCKGGAITIIESKAVVNPTKCLLCSYCARVCPEFAIKVI